MSVNPETRWPWTRTMVMLSFTSMSRVRHLGAGFSGIGLSLLETSSNGREGFERVSHRGSACGWEILIKMVEIIERCLSVSVNCRKMLNPWVSLQLLQILRL